MPLLRTPSKGDHDKGNGHDFFELLFFALSCRQKISRKDAEAPSINFQKCGRTEDRQTDRRRNFSVVLWLSTSRHAQVNLTRLCHARWNMGATKLRHLARPFVFSLCWCGGLSTTDPLTRTQKHNKRHHKCLLLGIVKKYRTPGLWLEIERERERESLFK